MRIQTISVTNILGCPRASVEVPDSGVLLAAGGHATGKSSVIEALRLAFSGGSDRAKQKKDWRELLTDGASSGEVLLTGPEGSLRFTLPAGAVVGKSPPQSDAADVCLGMKVMSRLKPAERVALVRSIGGATADAEIVKRLRERGHPDGLINRVAPLLRSSPEAAQNEAAGMARETKGTWRALTGETYGDKKALGWAPSGAPTMPEGTDFQSAINAAMRAAHNGEANLSAAERSLGAAQPLPEAELEALRVQARGFAAAEDARIKGEKAVKDCEARATAALALVSDIGHRQDGQTCPHCAKPVRVEAGRILPGGSAPTAAEREQAEKTARETSQALATARTALRTARQAAEQADAAAARVRASESIGAETQQAAQQAVATARYARDDAHKQLRDAQDSREWFDKRRQAASAHEVVQQWSSLAYDLGPEGVVADLSAGPVQAFAQALDEIAPVLGFDRVRMADDGALAMITPRGLWRDWWYCSESERWRIDVACLVAIAWQGGYGMVLVDHLDILLPAMRPAFLLGLTRLGLDLAVVGCAAANRPELPASIGLLWLQAEEETT